MRWIPVAIVGLVASLLTWAGPAPFTPWDDQHSPWMLSSYFVVLIYAPFLIVAIGGTAAAFRGLWISTRRAELASELALGRSRGDVVRAHTVAGLRDGLAGGAVGALLGTTARQLVAGFGGYFVADAVWTWMVAVALAAVCLTVAYWVVAAWATRGSVREVADSGPTARSATTKRAEKLPPEHGERARGRRRVWLWVAAGAVAAVVALGAVLAATGNLSTDESDGGLAIAASVVFGLVLMLTLYIGLPALLVWGGTRAAVRLSRGALAGLAKRAAPGGARSLAADALARPTPMRTGALAAVVTVMGVATVVTSVYAGTESRNSLGARVVPHATVSEVSLTRGMSDVDTLPSGWVAPLPSDVLEELTADTDLLVIPAGVLLTDPREREAAWSEEGEADWSEERDLLISVDATDFDRVVPGASDAMYLTAGAEWIWGHVGWTAPFDGETGPYVAVDGVREGTQSVNQAVPWAGVERTWAESVWGMSSTAAVLLYPRGEVSVAEALARHDLEGLRVEDLSNATRYAPEVRGDIVAAATAPFLAVAVAIVIALAWSTQRLRAKDQATLIALGATRGALRGAAALEAFVPTLIGGLFGVAGGALIGLPLIEIANAPLGAAGIGDIVAGIGVTASAMPWAALVGLVIVAAAVAAGGAALVRVRLDRLTPAQQLAEAQKAGIS
ncbi:ABC transporter permease [Demequina sp. NBRC 110056]|uniref:ABC transporter permease n=1 Tax=Demequina sp. NBRC 110056 TaxID=1570345 RepID=UPI0009FE95F8|nr:ABC transporter permease [Demequina sp. NBRC 110056]